MRAVDGTAKNYRQFGESITSHSERGWFLTLTDVYSKLHSRDPEQVNCILLSLDAVIGHLSRH
jgi:hypothetical protein